VYVYFSFKVNVIVVKYYFDGVYTIICLNWNLIIC
jgi:hypothetical protein